jgi:MULE transposase domain
LGLWTVYCSHLKHIIIIDVEFLSDRYKARLLIVCEYNAENKLLPLAFGIVNEENMDNWGWFMRWVPNKVIKYNMKIYVISDRPRGIKEVFQVSYLGWSVERGEAVHRYCMQTRRRKII